MTIDRRRLLGLAGAMAVTAACDAQGSDRRAGPARDTAQPGPSQPAPSRPAPSRSPTPARRGAPSPDGSDVSHGPRTKAAVALTFHGAGSATIATQILAEVARAGGGVTVLAVGSWLEQEPAMAARIVAGGHDLGNHTWSHRPMRRLGAATAREEVARCDAVLRRLVGTPGRWFRPSGTPTSTSTIRAAAARSGYPFCLSYDVDSLDYTDPGSAAVVRATLGGVTKGSIVSLHLGHQGTVRALPEIFDGLHARGLAPVTVTQLLA